MPFVADYSDGRIFSGKPIASHLLPDYYPKKEKQKFSPSVKIKQGGKVVRCLVIDGEKFSLQAI